MQLCYRGQEQASSEASSNITGTKSMATNTCQKQHIVALQETRNAGDRVGYNQDAHSATSQEPQLANNLDAVR